MKRKRLNYKMLIISTIKYSIIFVISSAPVSIVGMFIMNSILFSSYNRFFLFLIGAFYLDEMNRISEGVSILNILSLFCVLPSIFNLAINILNKKFLDEFKALFRSYNAVQQINENLLLREFIWLNGDEGFSRRKKQYINIRRVALKKRRNNQIICNHARRCGIDVVEETVSTKKYSIIGFSQDLAVKRQDFSQNIRFGLSDQSLFTPFQENNTKLSVKIKRSGPKNVIITSIRRKSIMTRRNTINL
jgi:hypothetical protein